MKMMFLVSTNPHIIHDVNIAIKVRILRLQCNKRILTPSYIYFQLLRETVDK